LGALGAQLIFEPHQKLRPWRNRVGFKRQAMPFPVGLLALLFGHLCRRFSWWFLTLVLRFACNSENKRRRQNPDADRYTSEFHSFHGLLPRTAEQTGEST